MSKISDRLVSEIVQHIAEDNKSHASIILSLKVEGQDALAEAFEKHADETNSFHMQLVQALLDVIKCS